MKLKYYLRGMGIGIILTAIVMGFALGGRKGSISDAEIIQRAKALGMVEADQGPLTNTQKPQEEDNSDDASTSDQTLDQEGKEISQEEQQEIPVPDQSVPEVDQEEEEGDGSDPEDEDAVGSAPRQEEQNGESAGTETVDNTPAQEPESAETQTASAEETTAAAGNTAENTTETTAVNGKRITIPGGIGSDQVAQILYNEGVVDNAVTFNRYLIDRGIDRIIRSGTKVIPDGSTYEQVANIITKG